MRFTVLATLLALASHRPVANAQSVLSVPDVTVDAGEFDLVVPIELAAGQDLTRLRFDLTFDPAFCDALEDPEDIEFDSDGRTIGDPLDEVPIFCEDGQIRIDVVDELGDVVIPAGSGPVIEFDFGSVRADVAGTFTFTLENVLARAGGSDVALTVDPGMLTIRPLASTTTTTSAPGSTVTTSSGASTTSTTTATASTTLTSVTGLSTTSTIASTTTTSTLPGACPDARTLASIACRLDELAAAAEAADLPAPLAARLAAAGEAHDEAAAACQAADTRLARNRLRSAIRALIGFRHRLGSLTARKRIPAAVRAPLRDAALAMLVDLRPLRRTLFCPPTSPGSALPDR